jgi:hypothetical protein
LSRRRPRIPGTRVGKTARPRQSLRPPILLLLPGIPDDLEPAEKNALALRNACSTEGKCPGCGTVGELHPDREFAALWHYVFEHEDWCAVLSDEDAA